MRRYLNKWVFLVLLVIPLLLSACLGDVSSTPSSSPPTPPTSDQLQQNAQNLWAVVGGKLQPIKNSAELANLIERINRENDPNHTWYVYIFSANGTLMFYSQIHGKVSSTDSSPTPPDNATCTTSGTSGVGCTTTTNPSLDGSYGPNEPGIFFFLQNAGNTLMETNFYYIVSDSYIPITQQPTWYKAVN